MPQPNLNRVERAAYYDALTNGHEFTVTVHLLTLDHKPRASVTPVTLDGQIDIHRNTEVRKTLQITFYDPDRQLHVDSESPSDGAMGADRMVQIEHSIFVPTLHRWVSVTPFTGPITMPGRDGDTVTIEAQGKERLALTDCPTKTIRAGISIEDAIKRIMREATGESKFAFPQNIRGRLTRDVVVTGDEEQKFPWRVCQRLARQIDCQLFYDGRGYLWLRSRQSDPLRRFVAGGVNSLVTEDVATQYDFSVIRNRVEVQGKTGVKRGVAELRPGHPWSPERLGRRGVPRRLTLFHTDEDIDGDGEAQRLADSLLDDYAQQHIGVTFHAAPAMDAEPGDLCRIDVNGRHAWAANFKLGDATLPLGTGGDMTVGYQKRVSRPANRIRLA